MVRGRAVRRRGSWSAIQRSLEPAATLEDRLPLAIVAVMVVLFIVQALR